jgi:hypothetical protein
LLTLALLLGSAATRAEPGAEPAPPAMSASAVRAAASAVEADPLLGGSEVRKTLRFKDKARDRKADRDDMSWWLNLVKGLSAGLRVALWLLLAGVFIFVLLRARDWLQGRGPAPALDTPAPTHIGTLDIRPESLPEDIGAAAASLLDLGEARAALSLLYRGALSRLVHGHGVPIRAASTERECLQLASPRLAVSQTDFLAQLVSAWQTVAYAHRTLPADDIAQLCRGFDAALPATPGAPA